MKISIVRSLALLSLSASLCSIVVAAPSPAPNPKMNGRMGGPGGGRMRMMKELKLTTAQQAKMKAMMDQRRAIRQSTSLSEDQKRAKMRAMGAKFEAILTPAQRKKRDAMMKERVIRWDKRGGRIGA